LEKIVSFKNKNARVKYIFLAKNFEISLIGRDEVVGLVGRGEECDFEKFQGPYCGDRRLLITGRCGSWKNFGISLIGWSPMEVTVFCYS
jgi:hypothetical protein